MRTKRLLVALLLLVALFAAACGNDSDDTGGSDGDDGTDTAADADGDDGAAAPSGDLLDVDAVLAADLASCGDAPSGDPFIIGFAADQSEAGGFADIPIAEAAQHFVDLINCTGGANGTPVELIVEDVQGNPEVAQRAASDLVAAGAHVILGPPFADTGQPVLQTVNASRAVIFVASTEPVVADPSIYSFLTTFDDTGQAEAAAQFAIDEGYTRAITFSSEGPYFGYNPEVFTEKFEELGGEVVLDQSYVPFEDFDFATQANAVADVADGSEILYSAMIAPQVDALRGQIEELGVEIAYIGADAFDVSGIVAVENNEGIYYTTHGFPDPGSRFDTLLTSLEAATGEASESPGFVGLAGDAVIAAVDGFLTAGSTDPIEIAEAIAGLSDLEVITTTTGYAGTEGVPDRPVFVLQIVDGEPALAAEI